MPMVAFTAALRRFLAVPTIEVAGATVGDALGAVFTANPRLKGYVLDDQGAVRRHVKVYINSDPVRDSLRLTDPVGPHDTVFVFQALTGG